MRCSILLVVSTLVRAEPSGLVRFRGGSESTSLVESLSTLKTLLEALKDKVKAVEPTVPECAVAEPKAVEPTVVDPVVGCYVRVRRDVKRAPSSLRLPRPCFPPNRVPRDMDPAPR